MPYRTPISEIDVREQFAAACRGIGLEFDGELPVMDGARHYTRIVDAPRWKKQGLYQGYLDGCPNGYARNYLTGEERKWRFSGQLTMTFTEAAEAKRAADARLAERNRQRQQEEARITAQARRIMSIASPALPTNPYIQRKQISSYGLQQTRLGLVVPMQDASGALRNVQTILPDGRKMFLKGPVHGLWSMVGEVTPGRPLGLVEGVATRQTVHEATGWPVAAAMSADNLLDVARSLRRLYPHSPLWIFGDDDAHLPLRSPPLPNVGRVKATEAAGSVGAQVLFPVFNEAARASDWNDLHQLRGLKAVVRQILAGMPPALPEPV